MSVRRNAKKNWPDPMNFTLLRTIEIVVARFCQRSENEKTTTAEFIERSFAKYRTGLHIPVLGKSWLNGKLEAASM